MDSDMIDTEATPAPSTYMPPAQQVLASTTDQSDGLRRLLNLARQLVLEGKPSQALQVVVMAMKTQGGDQAVFQALNRARELYRNKLQASAAADELASLFAECAIAEALPPTSEPSSAQFNEAVQAVELDANGSSILAESGRKQVVLDAYSDGSSFICLQCGGLVSNHRKDEHYSFWCCKI